MVTKESHGANTPVDRGPGYEVRDANVHALLQFAFWMAVVLAVTMVAMKWTFDYLKKAEPLGATSSPLVKEGERVMPPAPLLQVHPHQELEDYCAAEQKAVNSYGWVSKEAGVAHIPVDRAMDLVLVHGLPTRPANEAPAGAPTVASATVAGDTDVQGQCGYLTEPRETVASEGETEK
ncbi:MAG TPA: hypothetical protein VEJ38_03280 [Candidatus Acidoferrales bacterium]|nr:hypothetical protein [Candidatus Acidoferrales bacterium]